MAAITVRVSEEMDVRLNHLAEKLDRSKADVAEQAIADFVAREEWQPAEIEEGLAQAERGDFASDDDVARILKKYLKPAI